MRKSKYNSFDELPLMLTVEDVSHVLGIGLAHAYEVARRRDFPAIPLGGRIIVPRDKFMEWIDEQAVKNLRYYDRLQWIMPENSSFRRICVENTEVASVREGLGILRPSAFLSTEGATATLPL